MATVFSARSKETWLHQAGLYTLSIDSLQEQMRKALCVHQMPGRDRSLTCWLVQRTGRNSEVRCRKESLGMTRKHMAAAFFEHLTVRIKACRHFQATALCFFSPNSKMAAYFRFGDQMLGNGTARGFFVILRSYVSQRAQRTFSYG